jgi:hypothetical protein
MQVAVAIVMFMVVIAERAIYRVLLQGSKEGGKRGEEKKKQCKCR